ncbi:MAG: rhodanese-like domain-containing protein [Bacteroidetes bacterium]|nr:rhodanese-like domain-containing protein [Bacteroidota bacterium]
MEIHHPKSRTRELLRTAAVEAIRIVLLGAAAGFLFTALTGQGFFRHTTRTNPTAPNDASTPPFLTYEEAESLHVRQEALFVDARSSYDFGMGHIAGAVSIPLQDSDPTHPLISALPRDQQLVTYCDGEECSSSIALATLLQSAGFSKVRVFFGGWNEWRKHHQATEP